MLRNHLLTGALLTLTLAPLACGEPVTSTNSGGSPAIGGANTGGSPAAGGAPNAGGSLTGGSPSGGEASGGASSGGANSGGGGSATGGATSDSGGSASGGAAPNDNLFRCPDGSSSLTPTLGTATAASAEPPKPTNDSYRTEGPLWLKGALYVSVVRDWGDPFPPAQPLKWDGSSFTAVLPPETSGTNGMAVAPDGTIIAASHLVGGLLKIDITTAPATVTTLIAEYEGARFNSPNDLAIRSDGTVYFSDPDWQCKPSNGPCTQTAMRVYRYSGGQASEVVTSHTNPNGVALSPDEKTLYVTGKERMQSLPVNADGTVGEGKEFAPIEGADGMAIDCAGNIYVAANSAITVLDKAGATIGTINVAATPNNAAFGGPEGKTLYITTQPPGVVYSIDVGVPGYPY